MKITKNGLQKKSKKKLESKQRIRKQHLHNYCVGMKQLLLKTKLHQEKNEAQEVTHTLFAHNKNEALFWH